MYPCVVVDCDIEERRQSIATEKRCDNHLRTKANDVRCGGGERNKAACHPSNGDGDGNGNSDRRQALGGWWRRIRWQEMGFCCSVMGDYNFRDVDIIFYVVETVHT